MMKRSILIYLILIIALLIGCQSTKDKDENTNVTNKKHTNEELTDTVAQDDAKRAKKIMQQNKEVTDIHAVQSDKTIFVAFDVKQKDKLNMDDLEKKYQKQLESKFTNMTIELSFDEKLLLETNKLEKELSEEELSESKLRKRIKSLKELAEKQT